MVAATLASTVAAAMVAFTLAAMVAWVSGVGLASSWHARANTRIRNTKTAIAGLAVNNLRMGISSQLSVGETRWSAG